MLQGKNLVAALQRAVDLKRAAGVPFGPTALGRALGIAQPSASDLLKTGRISKERYAKLVAAFADVVGPEHWGLSPGEMLTEQEKRLLTATRALGESARDALLLKLEAAARAQQEVLAVAEQPAGYKVMPEKRRRTGT